VWIESIFDDVGKSNVTDVASMWLDTLIFQEMWKVCALAGTDQLYTCHKSVVFPLSSCVWFSNLIFYTQKIIGMTRMSLLLRKALIYTY
jgi:hypothetical protein